MSHVISCYRDFSGGLSELANDNMADNQLTEAVNVVPGDGYGIARAFGFKRALPLLPRDYRDSRLKKMITLPQNGNTLQIAFTTDDSGKMGISRLKGNKWVELFEGMFEICDWFSHNSLLYFLDGVCIYVTNGTSCVRKKAPDDADEALAALWKKAERAISVAKRGQRWFYLTENNELIFTEIGEPLGFEPTNIININSREADECSAVVEFNNGLLIFRRNSIFYLSGWDLENGSDISLTQLNITCGTRWPETIRKCDNGLMFLGEDGLYKLQLTSSGNSISVENLSDGKLSRTISEMGKLEYAEAEVWDNTYFLNLKTKNERREYRYYPARKAFYGPYTHNACGYSPYDGKLYMSLGMGYCGYLDKGSYAYWDPVAKQEVGIPMVAATKGFDVAKAMSQEVRLKKALVSMKQYQKEGSHLSVRVNLDYEDREFRIGSDESLVWTEGSYGDAFWGWKDTVQKELPIGKKTQRVRFYFKDDTCHEPLLIYGVALVYHKRRAKGNRWHVQAVSVGYEE